MYFNFFIIFFWGRVLELLNPKVSWRGNTNSMESQTNFNSHSILPSKLSLPYYPNWQWLRVRRYPLVRGVLNGGIAHLKTRYSKLCYQSNEHGVSLNFDNLSELVVRFQSCKEPAKLVIVVGIWKRLEATEMYSWGWCWKSSLVLKLSIQILFG